MPDYFYPRVLDRTGTLEAGGVDDALRRAYDMIYRINARLGLGDPAVPTSTTGNPTLITGTLYPVDEKPAGLTTAHVGYLFYATDFQNLYIWTGYTWTVLNPIRYVGFFTTAPSGLGWHLANGSTGVRASTESGGISLITVPNCIDYYLQGSLSVGNNFAVAPTLSGDTGAGGDHNHSGSTGSESAHTHLVSGAVGYESAHIHGIHGTSDSESAHIHGISGTSGGTAPGFSGTSGAGSSHTHTSTQSSSMGFDISHGHSTINGTTSDVSNDHTHGYTPSGVVFYTSGTVVTTAAGASPVITGISSFGGNADDTGGEDGGHTHDAGSLNVPNVDSISIVVGAGTFDGKFTNSSESSHTHGVGSFAVASHTHSIGAFDSGTGSAHSHGVNFDSGTGSAHSHSVSITSAAGSSHLHSISYSGTHTHTFGTLEVSDDGTPATVTLLPYFKL